MIATIQLIIKIGQILWDIEPTLYKAFMAIVIAIHPSTPPSDVVEVVKNTAKALVAKDNVSANDAFDAAVAELEAYKTAHPEYYGY